MGQRNNGQGEINAIQNRFTAYLLTALKRKKQEYIRKLDRQTAAEFSADIGTRQFESELIQTTAADSIPLKMRLEYLALMEAIEQLAERERFVLLQTALYGFKYEELTEQLGLQYSGVAAIHRRVMQKLRRELRHDDEF